MLSFKLNEKETIYFAWCPPGYYNQPTIGTSLCIKTEEEEVRVSFTKGFWITVTPITNGQWRAITGDEFFGGDFSDIMPVYGLDFRMTNDFIDRLNALQLVTGEEHNQVLFVLPNYLQSRYACISKASPETPNFWEIDTNKFEDFSWFKENSNNKIHEVARKHASPWGLFDMYGNVIEMSLDIATESLQAELVDPQSVHGILFSVGGGYDDTLEECVTMTNAVLTIENEYMESYGFRLICHVI